MAIMFPDPTALLLFDIPLFLFVFGLIFVLVRVFFAQVDPATNTAVAALAAGAAFIIVRSQWKIQELLWFNPGIFWAVVILIFAIIVIKWILHI